MTAMRSNLFIWLGIIAFSSLGLALFKSTPSLSCAQLWAAFTAHGTPLAHQIIFQIRLPRVLTAFTTGGLLALAGAMMQVLVRNPLADPYVLGVSGGAAVMTLLLMLAGFSGLWLTGGAWLGSLLAIFLVFLLTKNQNTWSSSQLLLTGIALASGFSACISFILLVCPEHALRGMLFWLVGDFSFAELPVFAAGILLLGLVLALSCARELNILVRGEKPAQALGVNTRHLQWKLFLLSSLLTATAVTLAGCIGFVGLIVPHVFRLLFGYDHRYLLPGCVLVGGSLLTLADMLARTIIFPQELPVGIIMALIGIPVFLILLQKNSA